MDYIHGNSSPPDIAKAVLRPHARRDSPVDCGTWFRRAGASGELQRLSTLRRREPMLQDFLGDLQRGSVEEDARADLCRWLYAQNEFFEVKPRGFCV